MDKAAPVDLAQRGRDADCQAQEVSHFHGRAKKGLERLAARIFEHQHGPTELERPHRPSTVQLVLQSVFVGQTSEACG